MSSRSTLNINHKIHGTGVVILFVYTSIDLPLQALLVIAVADLSSNTIACVAEASSAFEMSTDNLAKLFPNQVF